MQLGDPPEAFRLVLEVGLIQLLDRVVLGVPQGIGEVSLGIRQLPGLGILFFRLGAVASIGIQLRVFRLFFFVFFFFLLLFFVRGRVRTCKELVIGCQGTCRQEQRGDNGRTDRDLPHDSVMHLFQERRSLGPV